MSYQYRKTFTYRGKRYDVKADSHDELLQKIAEKKFLLSKGINKESNIKTQEYTKMWLETFKKPYVSQSTFTSYTYSIKCINRYIGTRNLRDVNSIDIQEMITKEFERGLSKSFISKLINTTRQVFRQAYADEVINRDPSVSIRRPKQEYGKGRALTDEELKAVIEVAQNHRHGLWILTMLYTGMRPNETARLRKCDIKDGVMHIRGTKTKKSDRYIPLPKPLEGKFDNFKANDLIFGKLNGKPTDNHLREKWWRGFKRDLDIYLGAKTYRNKIVESVLSPTLTLYCLRHTFGTNGQANGIPIDVLADLMGHEKIETTRKYYIHDNMESKNRAMDMLNSSYEKW